MKINRLILTLIIVAATLTGILIGNFFSASNGSEKPILTSSSNTSKIGEMLNLIDAVYVDQVGIDSIEEAILPLIIKQLDPHSAYIPAEDLKAANEQLGGSFSGIGVQFSIQNDTIFIVDVISGGPSERAGLLPGDRIVEVNDSAFVGKTINNERVMKTLRGEKGTQVRLGIARRNTNETLHFDVTRDDIPVKSIDVAYMITPKIGFVAVNKFGETTYAEFLTALAKFQKAKAESVIVDLRGNAGGYMDAAVNMLNEFLNRGDLIVYVEGRAYRRNDSRANGFGSCKNMKIAVLIDEFSGSASEIFAGAIQDNDRGTIIGRRSFGKGLVQNQLDLSDGSAVRLTIARYYTPSGRCIQKPYERGRADDYETDLLNRYLHGEFFSKDSIQATDTVKFYTRNGREVHGGGGIMPDIFVPRDTAGISTYFNNLVNGGKIYKFALDYSDQHRKELSQHKNWRDLDKYLKSQNAVAQMMKQAEHEGIVGNASDKRTSHELLEHHTHGYIIRNILGDDEFFPYLNSYDKTVERAIDELQN